MLLSTLAGLYPILRGSESSIALAHSHNICHSFGTLNFHKKWLKWASISRTLFRAGGPSLEQRAFFLLWLSAWGLDVSSWCTYWDKQEGSSIQHLCCQYQNPLTYGQLSLHYNALLKYSSGMTEIVDEAIKMQSILAFHFLSEGLMIRMLQHTGISCKKLKFP